MIILSDILFNNGDINNTIYGDISIITSYDEITQSAINNIYTIYGENQYHKNIGNAAYNRRLKISDSCLSIIEKDCINAIMIDDRIKKVISMVATRDKDNLYNVNVSFIIQAQDDTLMSSNIKIYI